MKKLLLAACIGVLCIFQPAQADDPALSENKKYTDWMTYYYLNKDREHVVDYLAWLQYSGLLEQNEALSPPVSAFLATVFAENPSEVKSWIESVHFTGETERIIAHALWLSGNGKFVKELLGSQPEYTKDPPGSLLLLEPATPNDLDMYWGAFSASGDMAYVRRVIDALKEFGNKGPSQRQGMDMRSAAAWSLGANMAQHELAYRAVQEDIKTRPDAIKIVLSDVMDRVKRNAKPFPVQDGDFSATLFVSDKEGLGAVIDKAQLSSQISSVKRGKTVTVKWLFSGMELTEGLIADVKYDLKVLTPAGTLYHDSEQKGRAALEGKVPSRFRVFTSSSSLMLEFEPEDVSGVYVITGEIRDNVGQKRVPLRRELTLVD